MWRLMISPQHLNLRVNESSDLDINNWCLVIGSLGSTPELLKSEREGRENDQGLIPYPSNLVHYGMTAGD